MDYLSGVTCPVLYYYCKVYVIVKLYIYYLFTSEDVSRFIFSNCLITCHHMQLY